MTKKTFDANELRNSLAIPENDQAANQFIEAWLSNFPLDEFQNRSVENVAGWLTDLTQKYKMSADASIEVYNPSLERHTWQASNTVVVVSYPDLPFMIDTIRIALDAAGIEIRMLHSHVFEGPETRAFVYIEIGRREQAQELESIKSAIEIAISSVETVIGAFPGMQEVVAKLISNYESVNVASPAFEFLNWMRRDQFIFLGYGEWENGTYSNCLGTLADEAISQQDELLAVTAVLQEGEDITFTKSGVKSMIHRHAYSDFVIIRDPKNPALEHRFVGLFTASVYHQHPNMIPVVRDKIQHIISNANVPANSHDGKALKQLVNNYPYDELFQSSVEELDNAINRALRIQERLIVRVNLRKERLGRFVSCLVYVPKERYNTELRVNIQRFLSSELNATESEFTTYFSPGNHARVRYTLRTPVSTDGEVDLALLEKTILDMCREWSDRLRETLCENLGDEQGSRLASLYLGAFPVAYREDYDTRFAAQDIATIDHMAQDQSLAVNFYQSIKDEDDHARFRVFRFDQPVGLSEVLPKFENLGWNVLGERPYEIHRRDGETIWLHEFIIKVDGISREAMLGNAILCQETFEAVWGDIAEDDSFNRLVLMCGLSWQEVAVLRSYARYMFQIQFGFSLDYIADTLVTHHVIARALVDRFHAKFDPSKKGSTEVDNRTGLEGLLGLIDSVDSLDEDRILRRFIDMLEGTVRTNFYIPTKDGAPRSVLSFKLNTRVIPDLPKPIPYFEIFVCSPRTEGVHLRGGPVARGGLRWSDRFEDFRTEVLGLVKAQQVKNSVIVPVGAKGGFVARKSEASWSRDRLTAEGIASYKEFISGLLDITDNRSADDVVPPAHVVCWDSPDPYLVVAADKGTATFSDIANTIAQEYEFWLGDAFASGGSQGYDHKKMGITARGAWVSVQRHFREMGMDVQSDPVTVLGIGDMSGDVFGNGMLLSESLLVVAAFNHRHIFIDPNPDAASSYAERARLFALDRSGWDDYNEALISKGGGVFSRSAKSIRISAPMKVRFGITENSMRPSDLISHLLRAELDLLWNGGIGTYVKANSESHAEVGDKANDILRVNGLELGARVVGEGGNLGLTQLGRVEYSLKGGRCNTDFIDNAGGVDCSDHEVNIKIALNQLVLEGKLTDVQRNQLLEMMTDEVSSLVLANNARQAQAISLEALRSTYRSGDHRRFMSDLADSGILDRELEFLPSDQDLSLRVNESHKALTRPELSVLVSYAKSELKRSFALPNLVTGAYREKLLFSAFPSTLVETYPDVLRDHQLADEIVATQLANEVVNFMGITFAHRLRKSTGADDFAIARAWIFCREVFDLEKVWTDIGHLGAEVCSESQLELLDRIRRLVRRAARWFVHNRRHVDDISEDIASVSKLIHDLISEFPRFLPSPAQAEWQARYAALEANKMPESLARLGAGTRYLFAMLSIHEVAGETGAKPIDIASIYFDLGSSLKLDSIHDMLTTFDVTNHWQAMAREVHLDELDFKRRQLTSLVVKFAANKDLSAELSVSSWIASHSEDVGKWIDTTMEIEASSMHDFALFAVASRALTQLRAS